MEDLVPLPQRCLFSVLFFFNDPATTEIYTLSLHDALPISVRFRAPQIQFAFTAAPLVARPGDTVRYTLTVSNIGNSTIRNLWLEDDLDARLEFVSSSARVQVTGENPLNWSFTDVAPNRDETVVLVLRLRDAARPRDLI